MKITMEKKENKKEMSAEMKLIMSYFKKAVNSEYAAAKAAFLKDAAEEDKKLSAHDKMFYCSAR